MQLMLGTDPYGDIYGYGSTTVIGHPDRYVNHLTACHTGWPPGCTSSDLDCRKKKKRDPGSSGGEYNLPCTSIFLDWQIKADTAIAYDRLTLCSTSVDSFEFTLYEETGFSSNVTDRLVYDRPLYLAFLPCLLTLGSSVYDVTWALCKAKNATRAFSLFSAPVSLQNTTQGEITFCGL